MPETVELKDLRLSDYAGIVGDEVLEDIRARAQTLRDARVAHINATAYGGGVAEILNTLVPLMRDVGLDAEWRVMEGSDEFFEVTKMCHNGLQGMDLELTTRMRDIWKRYNERNAAELEKDYDFVVVHDPQPAGLHRYAPSSVARHWIWRCHIDTSTPTEAFWDFFVPYITEHDALIFTMDQYVGPGLEANLLALITPTIDPLKPKNRLLEVAEARRIVAEFGPDPKRPLMTQVSRYDPWKDPIGVIDAYRLAKEAVPDLQLALVGAMASDDPEGWSYLERTIRHAGNDRDIYIPHNYMGVSGEEVGAFQSGSEVIVQKSKREGFGLTVTEAMWHARPVVGGNVGGIPLQIVEGETGFLVDSVQECAEAIRYLLGHPAEADAMGIAGRERVRERFLITRQLGDYLDLFHRLESPAVEKQPARRPSLERDQAQV